MKHRPYLFTKIKKHLKEGYISYKNGILRSIFGSRINEKTIILILNTDGARKIFDFNLYSLKMNKQMFVYNEVLLDKIYLFIFYFLSKLHIPRQNNSNYITIVYANPMNPYFVHNLRYRFKNANIILRYYDYYDRKLLNTFFNKINDIKLKKETYCRLNADKNELIYMPNFIDRQHLLDVAKTKTSGRVVFIGTVNNRRAEIILNLARMLKKHGVNFLFYCYRLDPKHRKTADEINAGDKNIIYDNLMSYEDYLNLSTEASCIVDLYRLRSDEGLSYRISEAIFLQQKIITDRDCLLNEPFYNPSNIHFLSDDENQLMKFLSLKCEEYKNTEQLTVQYWLSANGISAKDS